MFHQDFLIRLYETDKGNGRFGGGGGGGRPRSAEVPKRGFRITQSRHTIPIPHHPEQSDFGVEFKGHYVDLQADSKEVHGRPSLGPPVETDDEGIVSSSTFKPQHRRTASDSINVPDHYGPSSGGGPRRRPDSVGSIAESLVSAHVIPTTTPPSAHDSISSVAQSVTRQVSALSQAIVGPEDLPSLGKDGSDSSSKSGGSDMTATLKQALNHGRTGGVLKTAVPSTARSKEECPGKVLRTDSMSSSTTSMVSRDPSFSRYDGSESSSQSLSHDSFEVGSLFRSSAKEFQVICPSSSDDDVRVSGRGRQRACETPHVKGEVGLLSGRYV